MFILGIHLKQFLLNLVFQLQVKTIDMSSIAINNLELLGDGFTIPFLSPPNQSWPQFLFDIPESSFSSLERTINAKRIDLEAFDGKITGEAKDYGKVLELEDIRKILKRIPSDSDLELVFTRKLRHSYFTRAKQSFESEFSGKHLHVQNRSYFKIDTSNPHTSLETIKGLPANNNRKFVIFFLINDQIK